MPVSFEELISIHHKVYHQLPLSASETVQWSDWRVLHPAPDMIAFDDERLQQYALHEAALGQAWIDFYNRYFRTEQTTKRRLLPLPIPINWKKAGAVAAAILLAFVPTTYLLRLLVSSLQVETATEMAQAFTEDSAANARIREVLLPDSSKVFLYPKSTIRYASAFDHSKRMVELTGEAFFEVQKDKQQRPFVVKSGDIETEVLGTQFNVASDQTSGTQTISLKEGAVKVTRHNESRTLKPGDELVLPRTATAVLRQADWIRTLAWKNEEFHFEDKPLNEIIEELERWYGEEIRFRDGVCTDRFTLPIISRRSSIQKVLNALKSTRTIDYQITTIKDRPVIIMYRPARYNR